MTPSFPTRRSSDRPEATRGAAREMALAQPLVALADALLAKRHRQAMKRGRGLAKLPNAERHQLRIAVKKLRYTTAFFRGPYPSKRSTGHLAARRDLQESPGPRNAVALDEPVVVTLTEQ